ncbi:UDP-glucose 4-epimerase GalE [bacterium]|jgi:UDP-glucose 4-epimerase|nr:UDP-glucose 4-epimerase GalE [bacterium]
MARVLVVGGAGYVGSSACAWLIDHGHRVWVLDDLSTGHRSFLMGDGFTLARAGDKKAVKKLLENQTFDCVMHFGAFCLVEESVKNPAKYFENNVEQTRALIETLLENGVSKFIFSSTCAVFGDPGDQPIDESLAKNPINPYGETKLKVEQMLADFARDRRLQAIALRYFNACGTESKLRVGELHNPETHLIPNVLQAALENKPVSVFGNDYPTPDGTCVRDYIHVSDLAQAHEAAMSRLLNLQDANQGHFEAFNLGTEKGFSVLEILDACEKAVGKPIQHLYRPRRPGDPPRLVASSKLARSELGFTCPESTIEKVVGSAWAWKKKLAAPKKAVFLDRDGTINEDPGYLNNPDQLKLLPGVGEALAAFKSAGYLLIVVSNQSGVGRGLIEADELPRIHKRLDEMLSRWGVQIDDYELCLHKPDEGCACRKPSPKLILDAAKKWNIDLSKSYMIGDKATDMAAGRAAGVRVALVRTGDGRGFENLMKSTGAVGADVADFTADLLPPIADWILNQENAGS